MSERTGPQICLSCVLMLTLGWASGIICRKSVASPGLLLSFASQIDRTGSSSTEGPGRAGGHGPLLWTPQLRGLYFPPAQSRKLDGGSGNQTQSGLRGGGVSSEKGWDLVRFGFSGLPQPRRMSEHSQ